MDSVSRRTIHGLICITVTVGLCSCNLDALTSSNSLLGSATATPSPTPTPTPTELSLDSFSKTYLSRNPDAYEFSNRIRITLRIKNNGERRIKAWRAVLVVKNSFGDTILTSQITDGTANIIPGQVAEASYVWEDNQFIENEPYDRLMAYDSSNLNMYLKDIQIVTEEYVSPYPLTTPTPSPSPTLSPLPSPSPTPLASPTPQVMQGDYFPLINGAKWEYTLYYSDRTVTMTPWGNVSETIYAVNNINGQVEAKVLWHYKSDVLSEDSTSDIRFVKTDQEAYQIDETGTKSICLKFPMTVGSTFQTGLEMKMLEYAGMYSVGGMSYPETIRIRTTNKVAGFKNTYYAKGVGMVLAETEDLDSNGNRFTLTKELVRYTKP